MTYSFSFPTIFTVHLKPKAGKTLYKGVDGQGRHIIWLKEEAVDNKANIALIKFLKKEFGLVVRIKSGLKNREKIIEQIKN